jgi:fibronectin-binding autotransporter adhesin
MPTYQLYITPANKVKTLNFGSSLPSLGGVIDLSVFTNLTGFTLADLSTVSFKTGSSSANRLLLTNSLGAGIDFITGNSSNATFAGTIDGIGSLTKQGTGLLILTGVSGFSGPITIAAGTLQIASTGLLGNGTHASPISVGGALSFSSSADQVFSGAISGLGNLVFSGSGTVKLLGNNTYTGTTVVNSGILQVGDGGNTGTLGFGACTNNALILINRSGSVALGLAISGSGGIIKTGNGSAILSGSNTYTGGTILQAGILALGNVNGLGTGTLNAQNSATFLDQISTSTNTIPNAIVIASGITLTVSNIAGATTILNGIISGPGNLKLSGTGSGATGYSTMSLTKANTFGGSFLVADVVLNYTGTASTLPLNTTLDNAEISGPNLNNFLGTASHVITLGSRGAAIKQGSSKGMTVSALLTGPGSLYIPRDSGNGITLAAANTYTGQTILGDTSFFCYSSGSNATLILGINRAIPATDLVMNNGFAGTLTMNGFNATVARIIGTSGTIKNNHASTVSTLTIAPASGVSGTYAGLIQDGSTAALALVLNGAGSQALTNAANTYSGGTTLLAGTLNLGSSGAIGSGALSLSAASLDNTSGAALTLANTINANSFTFIGSSSLTFSGTVNLQSNSTLTINSASLTLSGSVAGAYNLTKAGSGTLNFTGTRPYSGTTTINAGSIVASVTNGSITATATFSASALSINFSAPPTAGQTYKFFAGATGNSYPAITLINAAGRTATYNSATSTLTIA